MKKSTELETKSPNDEIDLSGFNYDNLTGESFAAYKKIADSLPADKEFVYEQYLANGIFKFRLNEDSGEKEEYLFGIKINSRGALNTTKIPAKYARELNRQIDSKHPVTNSRYYLLKKGDAQNA